MKTGTSQAYHDNWTVGYTRDVTVGVWVGNFDRTPLRSASGVTGAAPIFHDVMLAAQEHVSRPPARRDGRDAAGGAGRRCRRIRSACCPGCGRRTTARRWSRSGCATDGCRRAAPGTARRNGRSAVVWPARYRAWARAQGLLDEHAEAAVRHAARPAAAPRHVRAALRIVSPPSGATYLRDPTLRAEFQTLPLRAETVAEARLAWEVDGRAVGTASSEAALAWPLRPGAHVVAVTDPRGRRAEASILVK